MKIVQVNYAYAARLQDPDALIDEYHTLTGWSEALALAGAEVSVVQAFHRDAVVQRRGISYVFKRASRGGSARASSGWSGPSALAETVASAGADVVHVNSLDFWRQTWSLRRTLSASTAIVVQDHASRFHARPGLLSAVRRLMMRAADAFFFTSVAQAEPWRAGGFITPSQPVHDVVESSTTMIPVGRVEAFARTGMVGRPAVLWVGRLNVGKDPLTVLDGFERALARLPGAVLTMIYSDDTLLAAVRRRCAASARLAAAVTLVGQVPHEHMSAYYSAADLFVAGSAHEGSGYALLEACACGAVPVVTRIPAFQAITSDGGVGVLWPVGDAEACASALVVAAAGDNDAERLRLRQHFTSRLSWPAIGRRAIALYEDVRRHRRSVPAV